MHRNKDLAFPVHFHMAYPILGDRLSRTEPGPSLVRTLSTGFSGEQAPAKLRSIIYPGY